MRNKNIVLMKPETAVFFCLFFLMKMKSELLLINGIIRDDLRNHLRNFDFLICSRVSIR